MTNLRNFGFEAPPKEVKVVIMAAQGILASNIVVQFVQDCQNTKYDSRLDESHRRLLEVDNQQYCLEVVGTAGTEVFRVLNDSYIRQGQGFILAYSVDSKEGFDRVQSFFARIKKIKGTESVPIVLFASDGFPTEAEDVQTRRVVSSQEGQEMALKFGGCPFIEGSGKSATQINQIFAHLVREMEREKENLFETIEKNDNKQH